MMKKGVHCRLGLRGIVLMESVNISLEGKMKKLCFLFLGLLIGCATITKGSKQTVAITSNVDGATLYLDGEKIGVKSYF